MKGSLFMLNIEKVSNRSRESMILFQEVWFRPFTWCTSDDDFAYRKTKCATLFLNLPRFVIISILWKINWLADIGSAFDLLVWFSLDSLKKKKKHTDTHTISMSRKANRNRNHKCNFINPCNLNCYSCCCCCCFTCFQKTKTVYLLGFIHNFEHRQLIVTM